MSANPKDLFDAVGQLTADALRPFSGSRKVKVKGSRPDIQVGIAEMQSALEHGMQEKADEFRRHGGEIYEKR